MKALLVIGSPKGKAGTSYALGNALFRKLAAAGMETEETTVSTALASPESLDLFEKSVAAADLIVFSFPLYVDQLPAPLIRALEFIAERRSPGGGTPAKDRAGRQKLAMIVQCGFPETHQNLPAVDIMRTFARETGFHWAGGLALGMGGAIGRRPVDKPSGMLRNVVRALDAAAAALAAGEDIPAEAAVLMSKPLMAKSLYTIAANFGMKIQARMHKAGKRVYDRPYASE